MYLVLNDIVSQGLIQLWKGPGVSVLHKHFLSCRGASTVFYKMSIYNMFFSAVEQSPNSLMIPTSPAIKKNIVKSTTGHTYRN